MINMEILTEKYRPITLKEVLGSKKNIDLLIAYGNKFHKSTPVVSKPLILHGKPGIGKTSLAHAFGNDFNFPIIEINSSDARTKDTLLLKLGNNIQSGTTEGANLKRLYIIDEVDNLEKSGTKTLVKLIKLSKHPIILTCNNIFNVHKSITDLCEEVKLQAIREGTIRKRLLEIAKKENKEVDINKLNEIIVKGDMRASVTNLQVLLTSKQVIKGERIAKLSPFEVVDRILQSKEPFALKDILMQSDLNPSDAINWIEENVAVRYDGLELYNAYEALSKADIYLKDALLTQNYENWKYATQLMTTGVALAHTSTQKGYIQTQYPTFLKKLSSTKYIRRDMNSLSEKLSPLFHCSSKMFKLSIFQIIQYISMFNSDFLTQIATIYDLTENELALILDSNIYDPRIKNILNAKAPISKQQQMRINQQSTGSKPLTAFF